MTEKEFKVVNVSHISDRYKRQAVRLQTLAGELATFVGEKDFHYGSSWRKRGGPGAFFVMARKWDRIEQACETQDVEKYDIFEQFGADERNETILNDCVDLIGYLLVLIEHMIEIGNVNEIKELKLAFENIVASTAVGGSESLGMLDPFGYDEEMDSLQEGIDTLFKETQKESPK